MYPLSKLCSGLVEPVGVVNQCQPNGPSSGGVVDPELGDQAVALLKAKGFEVSYHVDAESGHTITQAGLEFASAFIERLTQADKPVT